MGGGAGEGEHTYFAPAARTAPETLRQEVELVDRSPVVQALLRSVGGLLAVLDGNRQIIALNDALLEVLGCADARDALGLRPGEALQCVHAHEEPGGCGTSRYCSTCGNALAIVTALKGNDPVERNCALKVERDGRSLELCLRVRCSPVDVDGERVLMLFLQDITRVEEEAALEKTFLHDLSNLVMAMTGTLPLPDDRLSAETAEQLEGLVARLRREIELHKAMTGGLAIEPALRSSTIHLDKLFQSLQDGFARHPVARGRTLTLARPLPAETLFTDRTVLERILCNMLTNAFEASPAGAEVRFWVERDAGAWRFSVWNAAEIPPAVRLRIFQKHYTTKEGAGRGLGTFGMKLLGEKLLGGRVDFTSSAGGTTFRLELPGQGPGSR